MRTWRKRGSLTLKIVSVFAAMASTAFAVPREQDGVYVERTGPAYLYVFPGSQGRVRATATPVGSFVIGNNITIIYSLKITGGKRARFVAFDAAKVPHQSRTFKPSLHPGATSGAELGFIIRDSTQPMLPITIGAALMAALRNKATTKGETVAREGNLSVTFTKGKGAHTFKIQEVHMD